MLTYEHIRAKILTLEQAAELFTDPFRDQHRIVFTNGCFDLLHRGHVYYLARARELGDLLVVGLNSDASVTRLKGPGRPLNNQESRAEVLAALAVVDHVIIFSEDTPLQLINFLKPGILVKGGDYRTEEIVGYREVLSWGGKVLTIPLMEGYSTTSMIKKSR
ncbi:MAG: D-glycero-beta-D-manno-heptose 1-phosphate adenylyltransferase [Bacteroidales bacterium]